MCLFFAFCAVLIVLSIFTIISLGKRDLVASLKLSSCCHLAVSVLCLFLKIPWVGLQCVVESFLIHTHTYGR